MSGEAIKNIIMPLLVSFMEIAVDTVHPESSILEEALDYLAQEDVKEEERNQNEDTQDRTWEELVTVANFYMM